MAVQRIRLLGDPILRAKCTTVRFPLQSEEKKLIRDLSDTLNDVRRRYGFGRGIAAPQIGAAQKIIYINSCGVLINPRIVKKSKQMFSLWDDCFSFPDLLVKVKRFTTIVVRYHDEYGQTQTLSAVDALSELLQHELDHLNGILAIDRAVNLKSIVLRSEYTQLLKNT
jgi:peptide deformylase